MTTENYKFLTSMSLIFLLIFALLGLTFSLIFFIKKDTKQAELSIISIGGMYLMFFLYTLFLNMSIGYSKDAITTIVQLLLFYIVVIPVSFYGIFLAIINGITTKKNIKKSCLILILFINFTFFYNFSIVKLPAELIFYPITFTNAGFIVSAVRQSKDSSQK